MRGHWRAITSGKQRRKHSHSKRAVNPEREILKRGSSVCPSVTFCCDRITWGILQGCLVHQSTMEFCFNMTMELHTFYKTRMIFIITNELQEDYVAVQVQGDRVVVAFNDRKSINLEMLTDILINDGLWHMIQLLKGKTSISVTVDARSTLSNSITGKIDIIVLIYVSRFDPRFGAADEVVMKCFKRCMQQFPRA